MTRSSNWIKVKTICDWCGKQIERLPSSVKRNKQHFCSNNCLAKWRRKTIKSNRLEAFNRRGIIMEILNRGNTQVIVKEGECTQQIEGIFERSLSTFPSYLPEILCSFLIYTVFVFVEDTIGIILGVSLMIAIYIYLRDMQSKELKFYQLMQLTDKYKFVYISYIGSKEEIIASNQDDIVKGITGATDKSLRIENLTLTSVKYPRIL